MKLLRSLILLLATVFCLAAPQVPPPTRYVPVAFADDPKTTVVYITRTGKKYHRDGCRYLAHSRIKTTLAEAKANGYAPCKVCRPPE
jgi:hypothetical protein